MTLHKYQQYAAEFIENHPRCALFLDMGLGKTATTLTAIDSLVNDYFEVSRVLVIAPLRVAKYTWADEIKKWTPHLSYSLILGTEAQRRQAIAAEATIYIINRENVVWLYENYKTLEFDMLVIDELSSFKSPRALRFKALNKRHFDRVVGLTGTPAPNGLIDLWAEFKLIDGGERLGRFITQYRTYFFVPGASSGHIVFNYVPRAWAVREIEKRIQDITVSMKAVDYLDMPEMVTNNIKVTIEDRTLYDEMKKELVISIGDKVIDASSAAVLSNKLMQMANGAVYCEGGYAELHEAKLDALEEVIEGMNGKPLLIAYWFKHDAERIKKRFKEAKELNVKKWNEGKQQIALFHPASAGHGLNLQTGGNTMVWFGLTWSLELYQQANARLYRQGQTSKKVIIHHIVAKDTIDERVIKALQDKAITQDEIIKSVKQELDK